MTTTTTALRPSAAAPRPRLLRVLRAELHEELLAIVRDPISLFFSIAMPVAFYALFASLFGSEGTGDGLPVATRMLATFGTFGVLSVTLMNPGVGIAQDRERGWFRTKKVWPTPLSVTLAAKCLATLPYAIGSLTAMTLFAAASGSLEVAAAGTWLRLVAVLVLGGLPFGLIGLAVGLVTNPRAAVAVLQVILMPSAVVSGLWMPLEILPDLLQRIAPYLPTYHLAQLALAQLDGGPVAGHVLVLVATLLGAALLAGVAYRRSRA